MASHLKPSSKILSLIEEVRGQDSEEKILALDEVVEEIDRKTPTDPCLRCRNAEWILLWDVSDRCWLPPRLMSCRAYLHLPEADDRFGFDRGFEFHCSSENSTVSDTKKPAMEEESHSARPRRALFSAETLAANLARQRGQAPRA